jgi:hypothetical protein
MSLVAKCRHRRWCHRVSWLKLKLSHYTPQRRLGEGRCSSYSFWTSALDGVSGQRHAPAALCPGERTPGTHCTEGWVFPRAGLDTEARGKFLYPCRGSNLDRLVVEPVASHYTDWATWLTTILVYVWNILRTNVLERGVTHQSTAFH